MARRKAPPRRAPRSAARRTSRRVTRGARRGAGRRLKAGDLMTRNPITVPATLSVGALCDLFQEKNINGAPVVDEAGLLVGVVAQDDIIYGAMGHPESPPAGEDPEEPPPRRSRRMVEILRRRHIRALPDAPPRPGEQPFWTEARPSSDPLRMPVSAIMTSPAISVDEATPLSELCNVMWNLRIHRIPVVRDGKVTGLVSSMDLCRAILSGLIKV